MSSWVIGIVAVVVVAALLALSIRVVKQYERGHLAKVVMADTGDPVHKAMTEHAYFSREGSYGGGGVGGGGCGCN